MILGNSYLSKIIYYQFPLYKVIFCAYKTKTCMLIWIKYYRNSEMLSESPLYYEKHCL